MPAPAAGRDDCRTGVIPSVRPRGIITGLSLFNVVGIITGHRRRLPQGLKLELKPDRLDRHYISAVLLGCSMCNRNRVIGVLTNGKVRRNSELRGNELEVAGIASVVVGRSVVRFFRYV
ncbi:hypothetical protein BaRGS_00022546 [Batillaria attramentaria]|uniref:Uncharacterized protein n=1 Tax=Batillaria attramentaria TaxID=370345 RepID=A0ABD0KGC4_9CAEN